jgi:hypothetical protein
MNWTAELKKIEREFDGLPPEPSPAQLRAERSARSQERLRQEARRAALGVFVRLAPVLALAVGMPFWPYSVRCGWDLPVYFAALTMMGLGALWVATCTWRHRMAKTHTLTLLVVLWSLALLAMQVLPRVGYAKSDAEHPAGWRCS